jgi:hypothetical protein
VFRWDRLELCREDDGHDDAVYSDNFAENDGYEVFGSNPRCFNSTADNGGTSYKNAPNKPLASSDAHV